MNIHCCLLPANSVVSTLHSISDIARDSYVYSMYRSIHFFMALRFNIQISASVGPSVSVRVKLRVKLGLRVRDSLTFIQSVLLNELQVTY